MVDKWERESAGGRSPTRESGSSCSRSGSESDNGSEFDEGEVAVEEDVDVPKALVSALPNNGPSSAPAADDEPSIEDLLAFESVSAAPKDDSWGARAWEELEAGTTMRRIEPHDTVVPRRDGNSSSADVGGAPIFGTLSKRGGASNSGSSQRVRGTNMEDLKLARRTAADIFAVLTDTASTPALMEAGVQADVHAETKLEAEAEPTVAVVEAELKAKELALEGEVRDARVA
jgi:hypothetical protein